MHCEYVGIGLWERKSDTYQIFLHQNELKLISIKKGTRYVVRVAIIWGNNLEKNNIIPQYRNIFSPEPSVSL